MARSAQQHFSEDVLKREALTCHFHWSIKLHLEEDQPCRASRVARVVGLAGPPAKVFSFLGRSGSPRGRGHTQFCATLLQGCALLCCNAHYSTVKKDTMGGLKWLFERMRTWRLGPCGNYCFEVTCQNNGHERHSGSNIEHPRAAVHETRVRVSGPQILKL